MSANHKNDNEQLRQELLELHFDCHVDPDGLRKRLAEDDELQKLYAEVVKTANVLEAASKETAPTTLTFPSDEELAELPPEELEPVEPRGGLLRFPVRHPWFAAAAAIVLVNLVFCTIWGIAEWRYERERQDNLRLVLSAPTAVPDGSPMVFHIETKDLARRKVDADVSWSVLDRTGNKLASGESAVNGKTSVNLANVVSRFGIQGPRKIEVKARHKSSGKEQDASIWVYPTASAPLVHLDSDKPIYRPGETVRYRAAVLDRLSLRPHMRSSLRYAITDPKGNTVTHQWPQFAAGIAASKWTVPEHAAGGLYHLEVRRNANDKVAFEKLPFLVRRFQAPKLKTEITLDRKTYMAGEFGNAEVRVQRQSGEKIPAGATVDTTLIVDGRESWKGQSKLDTEGRALFRFTVPDDVDRGAARFVARITDGGVIETQLKPFVIPTEKIDVAFTPESGALVAGVESRVYASVTDALGRPISARGTVVNEAGRSVRKFETQHQGRARVTFVPKTGEKYSLKLEEPFEKTVALPETKTGQVVLRSTKDVYTDKTVAVRVHSPNQGPWVIAAFCRGVLVGQQNLHGKGWHDVGLEVLPQATGVLRMTVFNRKLEPVAERLVQRQSKQKVNVALTPKVAKTAPGSKQEIRVRTTNEKGEPIACILSMCVTDKAVRDLYEDPRIGLRDQADLFADVETPEDAEEFTARFYEERKQVDHSARNTDLLLGNSGWRRYAWKKDKKAIGALAKLHGDFAHNLPLVEGKAFAPQVLDQRTGVRETNRRWRAAHRSEGYAGATAVISIIVLAPILLGLGLWWLVSRFARPVRMFRYRFAFAGGAASLAWGWLFILIAMSGGRASGGLGVFESEDSAPKSASADPMMPPIKSDEVLLLDAITNGAWETRALDLGVDPAASPLSGFFYDDGGDGDLRAKTENLFVKLAQTKNEVAEMNLQTAQQGFNSRAVAFNKDLANRGRGFTNQVSNLTAENRRQETQYYLRRLRQIADHAVMFEYQTNLRGGRRQFAETLCWNPMLSTNKQGEATLSFQTSDKITTFVARADAFGYGRIGQAKTTFQNTLPFHMDLTLPTEVTKGDVLQLPVLFNAEDKTKTLAKLNVRSVGITCVESGLPQTIKLLQGNGHQLINVKVDQTKFATAYLNLVGNIDNAFDTITQPVRVVPRGFPKSVTNSNLLSGSTTFSVNVPDHVVAGTADATLKLYPSPLATIQGGLQGILREPHGCFEQASSSNYPNIMVLGYLEASGDNIPSVEAQARRHLPRGYSLTSGYECSRHGYEWFGQNPGHLALSAYGLLQFQQMKKYYASVDTKMVNRTRDWMLASRDGDGGYKKSNDGHSFGSAPQDVINAYVTYSLAAAGDVEPEKIKAELDRAESRSKKSKDAYELSLCTLALHHGKRKKAAEATRTRLRKMQEKNGSLMGTTTSITRSGKRDYRIETTALAALAWAGVEEHSGAMRRAVEFLQTQRNGSGSFGATQATILSLQALAEYAKDNRRVAEAGEVKVFVGGRFITSKPFGDGHKGEIRIGGLYSFLKPGKNDIRLELTGNNKFPWTFDLSYHSDQPADDTDCKVEIRNWLTTPVVEEGKTTALEVRVTNRTKEGLPMTMAIVGLPAGLHVKKSVLEDLKKAEQFDFWELKGREVILYWRGMKPGQTREVTLDLVARIPGKTSGPASRAYLYYSAESKRWAPPLQVTVRPAK